MDKPIAIHPLLKRHVAALLLLLIFSFSSAAQVRSDKQEEAVAKVDFEAVRQDILQFEAALNEVINRTFGASSFAVVQKAKGAYLEGYGISFSLLINIHRAIINTPFGQIRRPGADPEVKKQRIEELKEKLIQLLHNNNVAFRQLPKDYYLTVIAFIEDRNFPGEPNTNKTIVLSVLKKDLDELGRRNDGLKEFKQRMKTVEY
jgi:hypothetical protein